MLLSKEIAVYLNLSACKLKQYTASILKQSNVGLTPEQFLVIDILWNQGPMSQQQVADTIMKDKNSVTKLVDALERKGMVSRIKDPGDRRAYKLVLSEKAESLKNNAKEIGISMLDRMLDGIAEDELKAFLQTLEKMTGNMSKQITDKEYE